MFFKSWTITGPGFPFFWTGPGVSISYELDHDWTWGLHFFWTCTGGHSLAFHELFASTRSPLLIAHGHFFFFISVHFFFPSFPSPLGAKLHKNLECLVFTLANHLFVCFTWYLPTSKENFQNPCAHTHTHNTTFNLFTKFLCLALSSSKPQNMYLDFVQQTNQSIETHKNFLAVWMELHIPVMAFPEKSVTIFVWGLIWEFFRPNSKRWA